MGSREDVRRRSRSRRVQDTHRSTPCSAVWMAATAQAGNQNAQPPFCWSLRLLCHRQTIFIAAEIQPSRVLAHTINRQTKACARSPRRRRAAIRSLGWSCHRRVLSASHARSASLQKPSPTSKGQQGLTIRLPHDETAGSRGIPTSAGLTDFSKKRVVLSCQGWGETKARFPKNLEDDRQIKAKSVEKHA